MQKLVIPLVLERRHALDLGFCLEVFCESRLRTRIHRQIFKLAVLRGRQSVRKYSWLVSDETWGLLPNRIVRLLLALSWVLVSLDLIVNFSPFNGEFYNVCSHATTLLPRLGTSTTGSKVQRKRSRLFVLRVKTRSESIVLNVIYSLDKFEEITASEI